MKNLSAIVLFVVIFFVILPSLLKKKQSLDLPDTEVRMLEVAIRTAENELKTSSNTNPSQRGFMQVFGSNNAFDDELVRQEISKLPVTQQSYSYSWRWDGIDKAAETSFAVDRQHYFVNSFLVGFAPFKTDHSWVPLLTLAHRKTYQYDEVTYPGLKDVWQNSKDAFIQMRGDCEDHALSLADWLIEMGIDARVVLGKYKEQGHAWVVAILDGNEYLLEATSKRKQNRWSAYPLARYETDYQPHAQFNREFYWVNETGVRTTRYTGNHWVLKSKFIKKS